MRSIVYILFAVLGLGLVSCGSHRYNRYRKNVELFHIDDVETFYADDIEWILKQHKKMNLPGAPAFIGLWGLVHIFIYPTDSSYIIKRIRPEYVHKTTMSSKDTIIYEDRITVYEVPLHDTPLDSMFIHVDDTVSYYYDYTPRVYEYNPFYSRFALLDSDGNIKTIANMKTYTHTSDVYQKDKRRLPITDEILYFITQYLWIDFSL